MPTGMWAGSSRMTACSVHAPGLGTKQWCRQYAGEGRRCAVADRTRKAVRRQLCRVDRRAAAVHTGRTGPGAAELVRRAGERDAESAAGGAANHEAARQCPWPRRHRRPARQGAVSCRTRAARLTARVKRSAVAMGCSRGVVSDRSVGDPATTPPSLTQIWQQQYLVFARLPAGRQRPACAAGWPCGAPRCALSGAIARRSTVAEPFGQQLQHLALPGP